MALYSQDLSTYIRMTAIKAHDTGSAREPIFHLFITLAVRMHTE